MSLQVTLSLLLGISTHLGRSATAAAASAPPAVWRDITASAKARASDMLKRMTLQQKAMSMLQETDAFDMGDGSGHVTNIYNAECLHGPKAHGYLSTVFPSPIAQAASFDRALVHKMARATSDDLRSSWNVGQDWSYCFAPDVNLVRAQGHCLSVVLLLPFVSKTVPYLAVLLRYETRATAAARRCGARIPG